MVELLGVLAIDLAEALIIWSEALSYFVTLLGVCFTVSKKV